MRDIKDLTRAEMVRRRRLEQIQPQEEQAPLQPQRKARQIRLPMKKALFTGARANDLPPLTARGVINDFGIERRKKSGHRRFEAMFSPPRSASLPTSLPHPRLEIGWRPLSFLLVVLFGTALYLLWNMPQFRVSAAQVTGNRGFSAEEINMVLELNGTPVFLLVPDQIKTKVLLNYRELASVEAAIFLPNLVTVHITEREPVILLRLKDGSYTWIDEAGVALRPRGEAPGLITVETLLEPPAPIVAENQEEEGLSLSPPSYISQETVKAIQALAPYVPAGTPILYDPIAGLSWSDGRGWQAVFGSSMENMAVKVRVYQALVDWLSQRGIRPVLINVAYPNAPFYRLEQAEVESDPILEEQ